MKEFGVKLPKESSPGCQVCDGRESRTEGMKTVLGAAVLGITSQALHKMSLIRR